MTQRTTTTLVAALVAATLASACGDDPVEATVPTTVTVSPASVSLQSLDETVQLTATVKDQNGQAMSGIAVAWTSSDPAVGTVDDSGLVTAVGNGTVTVTATAWSASGTAAVMVDQVPTEVLVDPANDTLLTSGDTLRLSADALDSNGNAVAGAVFAWASTDTLVAVVDDEGLVTGVSAGEVEVTATSEGSTGRAQLTVAAPVPTTVTISPDTVAFHALGQTERLVAEVRDQGGRVMEGEAVSWSSADTLVATVDSAGRVTATGGGATTVAATVGSATATAVVTVTQSAGSVVISPPAATIALGDTLRLAAEAFDENGHAVAGAQFDWSSSDLSVMRVDGSGLATAVGEGRATVTAVADGARGTAEITVENPDRTALVALYNATDGPNWVDNTNWLTDAPLGEWYGVDTDANGRVVRLDLAGRWDMEAQRFIPHGLSGELPPELGDLSALRVLALATNKLSGRIPRELQQLAALRDLKLDNNVLSGPIPPELGRLVALRRLWLDRNLLQGPIPPELGRLQLLELIGLAKNQLTGSIPAELGDLANLQYLGLSENQLTGEIPLQLGDLASLRDLILDHNQLTAEIPPELGDLVSLEILNLSQNWLYGEIPPELGNLASLEVVLLSGNQLTGEIPAELGNLLELRELFLGDNRLSGPIPAALGALVNLRRLVLDENDLSGVLPRTFLELSLERFGWFCGPPETNVCVPGTSEFADWVEGTEAFGGGPFCNASDQRVLTNFFRVTAGSDGWIESEGWLGGPALEEWHGVRTDSLGRVTALHLSDNGLQGPLPVDIARLDALTGIRLDGNPLRGRLPVSLMGLGLREFHYDDTELCEPADDRYRGWLDGIESHRGTGVACAPLTDRDVLAALYWGTGGRGWRHDRHWLSHNRLGQWQGVEVNNDGRVVGLDLPGNDLSGPIPPALGALTHLERLNLSSNDLSGPIPPELGDLANLRSLILAGNQLTGGIPPELGDLSRLRNLVLVGNQLTGGIPPQLGDLSSLQELYLGWNNLSGPIPRELGGLPDLAKLDLSLNDLQGPVPPQLGDLSSLRELYFSLNDLSGPIPRELGNLANLLMLDLSRNDLQGPIPLELGNLASLQSLDLSRNDLQGPIPPELGDLASLLALYLSRNQLTGEIPSELGSLVNLEGLDLSENRLSGPISPSFGKLANLERMLLARNEGLAGILPTSLADVPLQLLMAGGTDLCAPSDRAFQAWLATIPRRWVADCGEAMAYLVQAVQSRTHPVPLVAGEGALLRVFVTARRPTNEALPPVRARFYLDGTERHVVDIPAATSRIPTDVDEGELSESANAEIPGHIVRPGLEMVVEIDPGGSLDPALGVARRIPETGRMSVEVREMPTLDITAIPFLWNTDPDSVIVDVAEGMAADPEQHSLLDETRILLPVRNIEVTVHEPVLSPSNDAFDLLTQTEALRVLEGGGGHYLGLMSGSVARAAGVAYAPGRSSFSRPFSDVVAHELGHNMGLLHAPCGGAGGPDPWFPDPYGRIDAWGHDSRSGRLVSPARTDLMSYCTSKWISGYHFTNALEHRLKDEAASARAATAAPTTSLLLWGGVDSGGNPFLNPAFVAEAPAALPDSAGDHTLTGRDTTGDELFSLNFAMPRIADADGQYSFAFMLPVRPGWADALATITLSGPGGSFTLDGATDAPMAILRNPVTGQIRGFLRDLPQETQAAMDAAGRAVEPGLEVLFSRGIPAASEWRR